MILWEETETLPTFLNTSLKSILRRNDTLRGDGNFFFCIIHKTFFFKKKWYSERRRKLCKQITIFPSCTTIKKKWYSERRRKRFYYHLTTSILYYFKKKWYSERRRKQYLLMLNTPYRSLRRNDTLRGDGNKKYLKSL